LLDKEGAWTDLILCRVIGLQGIWDRTVEKGGSYGDGRDTHSRSRIRKVVGVVVMEGRHQGEWYNREREIF